MGLSAKRHEREPTSSNPTILVLPSPQRRMEDSAGGKLWTSGLPVHKLKGEGFESLSGPSCKSAALGRERWPGLSDAIFAH
jgi:hypothetical protein